MALGVSALLRGSAPFVASATTAHGIAPYRDFTLRRSRNLAIPQDSHSLHSLSDLAVPFRPSWPYPTGRSCAAAAIVSNAIGSDLRQSKRCHDGA